MSEHLNVTKGWAQAECKDFVPVLLHFSPCVVDEAAVLTTC